MNGQKQGMLMPALIGGAAAGILSGIPLLNCLCCLWIIVGAILASFLLSKSSPTSLGPGDGALVGAFSGVVAAVVDSILSIPFQELNTAFMRKVIERFEEYGQSMPSGWDTWFQRGEGPISTAWFFIGLLITAAIFSALGALGGVIGMALFRKKSVPGSGPAPQPPQPPTL
jgi:hypothetical protein